MCNLTEVVVRPEDTLEDLKEKVRKATILGTIQSTLCDFRYLRKIWSDNQKEERLLGVSLTGIMDHPVMSGNSDGWTDSDFCGTPWFSSRIHHWNLGEVLRILKQVAKDTNKEWADRLGIPHSKQIGLIKPSGTVSLLCGTSAGMHPRFAPYYFRRVTQDIKDPLTDLMIAEGVPYVSRDTKVIFTFPMKSPEGSICAKEMGAMKQLEIWKVYSDEWCDGNPSQTIYYTDGEFLDIQAWLWKHWDSIGGLSFFPLDDYVYDKEVQPYLEVTKEEYEEALSKFPKINWERLKEFEHEDTTTSSGELACSGGQCEL